MAPELLKNPLYEENCCAIQNERKSHHSEKVKQNLVARLNRIEG